MKITSYSESGRRLATALTDIYRPLHPQNGGKGDREELVIVTPDGKDHLCGSAPSLWREIQSAWMVIRGSDTSQVLTSWRLIMSLGDEIVSGLRVFRLRNSTHPIFFYLLDKDDHYEAVSRLSDLFWNLLTWWHFVSGRGYYHSAAVIAEGRAFLFVGPSGAGKTTVSELSTEKSYHVIHDDHNVVFFNGDHGGYRVADRFLQEPSAPLAAVFFLNQDRQDCLVPIPAVEIARGLMETSFEGVTNAILTGELLRSHFAVSAEIARHVPGFSLHFRKSSHFWDLIHAECGG